MTTAIYFVNGTTQVVLTPESDWERTALAALHAPNARLTVLRGEFYECRGGWYRQGSQQDSTMLRIDNAPPVVAQSAGASEWNGVELP